MSSLFAVDVVSVDLPSNSCMLTVQAVNHDQQEVPSDADFYGNVLADLYLVLVLNLSPPLAYLKGDAEIPTSQAQGLDWFWAYAMRFSQEDREEIMALCTEFGPRGNVASEHLDTLDEVMWEHTDALPNVLSVTVERRWRNQYNCEEAQVKLVSLTPHMIEFLIPGVSLSTVYGPEPTWDVL